MDDLEARKKAFMDDYQALTEKHGLDFLSMPVFTPHQDGYYVLRIQPELMDTRIKSPIVSS